tara:strand:+ start:761 stop:1684 length:924 start_codon:yes stop_codon:yes gene_type:complete
MNLKKPKFWDKKKPNIYAYLLYPIALIIKLLNALKISKPKRTVIKTICVGNFYIGGTGKTSLSLKINEILKNNKIKSCFVKKFYKNQIDEQKMLKNNGKLFLSKNRIEAIKKAEKENYDVVILDDGLQDNTINYNLSFVCFNNINWIGNGLTIPAGPLREELKNLKKYKHVFLNGNMENIEYLKKQIFNVNPEINIHIGIYKPLNLSEFKKEKNYLIFSGIGNHQTFLAMMKKNGFKVFKDIEFPDHYNYNDFDIKNIIDEANKYNCEVITTEKDYLRIENSNSEKIKFIKSNLEIIDEEKFIKILI